jgi:predicted DNA-binding transcriptional regulator AlpA
VSTPKEARVRAIPLPQQLGGQAGKAAASTPQVGRPAPEKLEAQDVWWTTKMVCAFLKVSRKTLWERRRNPALDFPAPVCLGGARNVYRSAAIRAWADTRARDEAV